ncbi:hypothetical protein N7468_004167 [Penicillium chermesinum]|uniref:Cell wall protein n=1 Tax=Penicillium chermesinum TaxID=63820 RepID=A0A9W9PAD4_9EURO|nr:uncharacterized protein N7468_004167 [Penicillium chermesinum]KAJ5239548.1 hypothetical protein N7468_004167 [Penicillium chermesinum]
MRFSLVVSTLALIGAAKATVSAQQVVANIDAITSKSSETNDIAKTISITNFFSTTPQVIRNFRDIIAIVTQDINAMESKRSLMARQECLDLEDIERCLGDLGEIVSNPSELLGGEKKKRQSPGYSDTDQEAICTSFRGFVQVHQQLLQTVIGKHGLLSLTPFTQPIAQILRTLEAGVDTIAFETIDSVPTCAQDATQNKDSLDKAEEGQERPDEH